MRYAIVESGGKQYKAVEGEPIEVDRLPVDAGDKVGLERVLMLVDGDDVTIGTPAIGDLLVNTTVVDHFKGPKITIFKYSPKKRIRVKSGHRQQYTRLMVDVIGKSGETRKKAEKSEAPAKGKAEAKAEKKEAAASKPAAKEKKTEKAPATKSSQGKKTETKKTTKKASSAKTNKK